MFGPKPAPEQLRDRSLLLKGAIFSDGSTWGDPAWVRVLILRRAAAYRYETEALSIVMDAKVHSIDSNTLLERLKVKEQKELRNAKTTPEKQLAVSVFGEGMLLVKDAVSTRLNNALAKGAIEGHNEAGFTDIAVTRLTFRLSQIEGAKPPITPVNDVEP
jgi:hypothetical protein